MIKALDRALKDDLRVLVADSDPQLDESATTPVPGTAPAVKLVERQPGRGHRAGRRRAGDLRQHRGLPGDRSLLTGDVGDTVILKAQFNNRGPAWVLTREGDPLVQVLDHAAAGTSVVEPHGFCEAKGKAYACGTSQRWVDEDGGETYVFKLKIDRKVAGAKGSVALSTEARPFDPDKTNDRDDITLDVTDGGSTGSTGSSGSTGSTGSAGSTGGSTDGSDSSAGGSSAGDSGSSTTGGNLAATGSSSATLPIAGAALAVAVAGAGTLVAVRRRAQNPS